MIMKLGFYYTRKNHQVVASCLKQYETSCNSTDGSTTLLTMLFTGCSTTLFTPVLTTRDNLINFYASVYQTPQSQGSQRVFESGGA